MISHEDISYCVVWLFLFHTREPYPRALKVLVEIYGARVPPVPLAAIIAAFFSSSSSLMTGTYSLFWRGALKSAGGNLRGSRPASSFGCHYRGIFWFRSWQEDDLVGFSLKGICKLKVHGCGAFHIANDDLNCLASLQSFLFLSRVAYRVSSF